MSSFSAPRLFLPRYADGDIYGFSVLLNNEPGGLDDNFPVFPHWSDGQDSNGGVTAGHNTRNNTRGQIIGVGAVGGNKDSVDSNVTKLSSPLELQDIMDAKTETGLNNVKQPTFFEYAWYDPTENEEGIEGVQGSNLYTFSAAFHEVYYITPTGKLRNMGTRYNTKPAIANAFRNIGGLVSLGLDWRMLELWEENPDNFGYNPDINLKHICVASDECIITLDTFGTIRIVQAGTSGVELTSLMGELDYHHIVYFNKEDLEDNFWIDENGNTVSVPNVDFVQCWASGGGTTAQGICVWGLKRDGTLYYQDLHNMVWFDPDYWKRDTFNGGFDASGTLGGEDVQPTVREKGKYRSEPFRIQKLEPPEEEDDPSVPGTWLPKGPLVINPYHGAKITGTLPQNDENGHPLVRDLNNYRSVRQTRRGSTVHQDQMETYFDFSVSAINDPVYGPNSVHPGWVYEAGRNSLNQIPVNSNGNRFKVISLFDGYGHGGGCVCVDPDEPIGDPVALGHPDQMVEPVLLNSWVPNVHKHMYEQLHKIKRYRVVKNGLDWQTISNISETPDPVGYEFDQELFDLLYKDNTTGAYIPPRRISSSRRNFTIMSNTGMVASFQGGGGVNETGDALNGPTIAPLVNYEIDPDNPDQIKLMLDINGKQSSEEFGNWFYNYDPPIGENFGDPVILEENNINAYLRHGAIPQWGVNIFSDDGADPTHGPHDISGPKPENNGRFGFGNMPRRQTNQRGPIGSIPGLYDKPFTDMSAFAGRPAWAIHYFAWTEHVGYEYESNYWNQDSLVYMWSGKDIVGETIFTDPNFKKGSSIIQVWHAGEGSPFEPFTTDPVVWWSGQGDNINAVFQSGIVDSCSYYESEMSAAVMPPLTLPLIEERGGGDFDRPLDPDPPFSSEELINITQDTESGPGSTEGGGGNPEPECGDSADEGTDDPDIDKDDEIILP